MITIYLFRIPIDDAKVLTVSEVMSVNDIVRVIRNSYDNCGHAYDFDGLMDEVDMIFKVDCRDMINEVAVRIANRIWMLYDSYENMLIGAKVALFECGKDDANYNPSLQRKVLRLFRVKMDMEEMLNDYKQI